MKTSIGNSISEAVDFLQRGQLVAIPTETVYGLAANALDANCVQKIFIAKNRPSFNPLIVHIKSAAEIHHYAVQIPDVCLRLAEKFWPGPLTFVLSKKDVIPDHTTGGGNSVALRMPAHPVALQLLQKLDFPLAAPSANPSGYISPVKPSHVFDQLQGLIPYILDGGDCKVGIESTVIGFEGETVVVFRLGGLSISEIEKEVGKVELKINQNSNPNSPGQLSSHYAPHTPLILGDLEELVNANRGKKIGVIAFGKAPKFEHTVSKFYNLSPLAKTEEAAANIFKALREMDASSLDLIISHRLPENGLGQAVNDRLERAAYQMKQC